MANKVAIYAKGMLLDGQIKTSHTYYIILMNAGFDFDGTIHKSYADVSADELISGYGYITGGIQLKGINRSVNVSSGKASLSWNNVQWLASGGSLVASGAIIYNDSTDKVNGDDYTDAIISYIDFMEDVTVSKGQMLRITNINILIA